ncbi:PilZ domain-containing protein [Psychromarinibacter halotolerans]|uniref:PilZ domain-containing protein n=1 Tax=Psychromarinibacter halotolerans TaxID=1775175 RepID=A0ABV7GS82_9RHOB|nr:PilZ domain-containing protein [Psychromarinibacter halotolerans]MDF0596956.1 PilZ domain-containing protein [Psychromarinibacter halotolerans]
MKLSDFMDDRRVPLALSARLETGEGGYDATVTDLSYGGACLEAPDTPEALPKGTLFLTIDDLGTFDVLFRWRKDRRIGVSFVREHDARPRLEAFFASRGISLGAGD